MYIYIYMHISVYRRLDEVRLWRLLSSSCSTNSELALLLPWMKLRRCFKWYVFGSYCRDSKLINFHMPSYSGIVVVILIKIAMEMCQYSRISNTSWNVSYPRQNFLSEFIFSSCTQIQKNLFEILLNQTEIRLYLPFSDWFSTKRTSVSSKSIKKW